MQAIDFDDLLVLMFLNEPILLVFKTCPQRLYGFHSEANLLFT